MDRSGVDWISLDFGLGGQRVPRRFSIEIDEPCELGGGNAYANPQEHLLAALNACMTVGYVAQCAVRGITLEKLEIETEVVRCRRLRPHRRNLHLKDAARAAMNASGPFPGPHRSFFTRRSARPA